MNTILSIMELQKKLSAFNQLTSGMQAVLDSLQSVTGLLNSPAYKILPSATQSLKNLNTFTRLYNDLCSIDKIPPSPMSDERISQYFKHLSDFLPSISSVIAEVPDCPEFLKTVSNSFSDIVTNDTNVEIPDTLISAIPSDTNNDNEANPIPKNLSTKSLPANTQALLFKIICYFFSTLLPLLVTIYCQKVSDLETKQYQLREEEYQQEFLTLTKEHNEMMENLNLQITELLETFQQDSITCPSCTPSQEDPLEDALSDPAPISSLDNSDNS